MICLTWGLYNDLRGYEFSWGDLFDFSFQPWGLHNDLLDGGFGGLFDFSFQSWGLNVLHRYEFSWGDYFDSLSGHGGWAATCVDMGF